jgi:hypothetical protein
MAFRGARHYLHSTDLYAELIAGAAKHGRPVDGAIDIRFKRPIVTQVEFHFDGDVEAEDSGAAEARFAIGVGDRTIFGRISATGSPVIDRKPYDEQRIWSRAQIADRSVSLAADSGCEPIEVVTALGVLLHNTVFPVAAGNRWLLARLSLLRPLRAADATGTSISIERSVGHSMTQSRLASSHGALGQMSFIVGAAVSAAGAESAPVGA